MTEHEHDRRADALDEQADEMEERAERLEDDIEGARKDWERRKADPSVPGAPEDTGDEPEQGARYPTKD